MNRYLPLTMLLLAALFWGAGNSLSKLVLVHVEPLTAVGLRCTMASLVLALFISFKRNGGSHVGVAVPAWRLLRLSAIFSAAITLQQLAFSLTTATNVGFLVNTCTIFTPIVAWLLLRDAAHRQIWGAALVTLVGIFFLGGGGGVGLRGSGAALGVASAVAYALWMVELGEIMRRYGNALQVTALQFSLAALPPALIGLLTESTGPLALHASLPSLFLLAALGTAIPYVLQAYAQQHVPASQAAIAASSESVFGAAVAAMLLGERMTATEGVGAALVLFAIVWSNALPQLDRNPAKQEAF
jgi:drug/metabolite transporter (DMT)-like permease